MLVHFLRIPDGSPRRQQGFAKHGLRPRRVGNRYRSVCIALNDHSVGTLRPFADLQPVSVVSDAVRALSTGNPADGAVLRSVAWIVGLTAVSVVLAVRAYRRP